ncbi:hypothetical protein HDF25_004652 [Pedobacter cryoconitis]|uniref:Uncharacterized protein n=1 Tax=Pedobacter cryoconitis TaxID=188932 RepID=A0A7X0J7D8_9SPHI|nr:hypothetical protein [Pedobacter cryoconitis]
MKRTSQIVSTFWLALFFFKSLAQTGDIKLKKEKNNASRDQNK